MEAPGVNTAASTTRSILVCLVCAAASDETMPTDACLGRLAYHEDRG